MCVSHITSQVIIQEIKSMKQMSTKHILAYFNININNKLQLKYENSGKMLNCIGCQIIGIKWECNGIYNHLAREVGTILIMFIPILQWKIKPWVMGSGQEGNPTKFMSPVKRAYKFCPRATDFKITVEFCQSFGEWLRICGRMYFQKQLQ